MSELLTAEKLAPTQPRAIGSLRLSCRNSVRGTELSDLRHSGSMKALFPSRRDKNLTAVFLNTAGGITGGDCFSIDADVGPDAHLTMTSQAAERAYRAQPGEVGTVTVKASVAAKARLDWMPQETLLYDGSALHRRLDVSLESDSTFLAVEPLVFGRVSMGEQLLQGNFRDNWRVRRSGELVFADMLHLRGNLQKHLSHPTIAGPARAMASVLYVSPDAEVFLDRLRPILGDNAGVSVIRSGVLFARFLAPDSFLLRRTLIPVLEILNQSPLPKTWMF